MQRLAMMLMMLVTILGTTAAFAQPAPTFEKGKREDVKAVKEVTWTAKGEAGLAATTGNAKTITITAGANVTRRDTDNKLELKLDGTFARATTRVVADTNGNGAIDPGELSTSTSTSAENAALKLRYDRYLTEVNALFVAALAATDRPAGQQLLAGGQIGYSRGLYKSDDHELLGEVGYDLGYLRLDAGGSTTIHSARGFVGYKGKLRADATAEASLEGLFNLNAVTIAGNELSTFEDVRLNGLVGVTTTLSEKLSLSASFTARFDNGPAPIAKIGPLPFAPGFVPVADKFDTITKVSLIVTFL